jgi:heme/copper-type cytochrome/quinol oxidase subunit 2
MLTLTMPHTAWFLTALIIFMGTKFMQRSGELFGQGRDWHGITMLAALCIIGPMVTIAVMLIFQNMPIQ